MFKFRRFIVTPFIVYITKEVHDIGGKDLINLVLACCTIVTMYIVAITAAAMRGDITMMTEKMNTL